MDPQELEPKPALQPPQPNRQGFVNKAKAVLGLTVGVGASLQGLPDATAYERPPAAYAEPSSSENDTSYEAMAAGATMERVAGENRIDTAIEIAKVMNPEGNKRVMFLANGYNVADAIAVGPASSLRAIPVLLTGGKALESENLAELRRGTANNIEGSPAVYILGGTAAVSAEEEEQVKAAGFLVERIGGVDRYDTAARINRKFFGTVANTIWLANGMVDNSNPAGWADAMGAASLAGTNDRMGGATTGIGMMVLSKGNQVTPESRLLIQETLNRNPNAKVIAFDNLSSQAWPNAWKVYRDGSTIDRIIKAAEEVAPGYRNGRYGFAGVDDPADALAATGHISVNGGLFLVPRDGTLPASLKSFLERTGPESLREGIVLGGTAAISESIVNQIRSAAGV